MVGQGEIVTPFSDFHLYQKIFFYRNRFLLVPRRGLMVVEGLGSQSKYGCLQHRGLRLRIILFFNVCRNLHT